MTEDLSESAAEELLKICRECSNTRQLMYEAQEELEAKQKTYIQRREAYTISKNALNAFLKRMNLMTP